MLLNWKTARLHLKNLSLKSLHFQVFICFDWKIMQVLFISVCDWQPARGVHCNSRLTIPPCTIIQLMWAFPKLQKNPIWQRLKICTILTFNTKFLPVLLQYLYKTCSNILNTFLHSLYSIKHPEIKCLFLLVYKMKVQDSISLKDMIPCASWCDPPCFQS